MSAADVLVEWLIDWGVDAVFGLPGDAINGIMEALRVRKDKVRFIHGLVSGTAALPKSAFTIGAAKTSAVRSNSVTAFSAPYTTGTIGLLGTRPSQEAMASCGTLLMAGTSFPYIECLPDPKDAKAVQIELDPKKVGPMKPQLIAHELGKRLREDAIVSCDSGTIATWWARHIPAKAGQMHSLSGNLASMANGLPYVIAAQVAYPQRQCAGFVGDGGFSMLMADFVTAVKYKLPIKIVVVKNNTRDRSNGSRWCSCAIRTMELNSSPSISPPSLTLAAERAIPLKIRKIADTL
jgi:thiamine pyrophosphate-dependent acetolactate synthase large subunit-like protein